MAFHCKPRHPSSTTFITLICCEMVRMKSGPRNLCARSVNCDPHFSVGIYLRVMFHPPTVCVVTEDRVGFTLSVKIPYHPPLYSLLSPPPIFFSLIPPYHYFHLLLNFFQSFPFRLSFDSLHTPYLSIPLLNHS